MAGSSCPQRRPPSPGRAGLSSPLSLTSRPKQSPRATRRAPKGDRKGGNHWRRPPAASAARLWPRTYGTQSLRPPSAAGGPRRPGQHGRQMRQTLGRRTPYLGEPRRGARRCVRPRRWEGFLEAGLRLSVGGISVAGRRRGGHASGALETTLEHRPAQGRDWGAGRGGWETRAGVGLRPGKPRSRRRTPGPRRAGSDPGRKPQEPCEVWDLLRPRGLWCEWGPREGGRGCREVAEEKTKVRSSRSPRALRKPWPVVGPQMFS